MNKKIPQYLIIEQDIIEKIQGGTFRYGDQIMTESELCDIYNVSRMTVNRALSSLVSKGYLTRTAGKGTFVLIPKVTKVLGTIGTSGSFSNDIRQISKTPGAILLEYRVIRASSIENVAKKLDLKPDELIHHISRIRTSDDVRVALSNTYIPCRYLPSLNVTILEGSLYDYLDEKLNIHPAAFDYTFNAVLPTEQQKELLKTDSCALLKVCHCCSAENMPLFEYTETYYAGNRYTYRFQPQNLE